MGTVTNLKTELEERLASEGLRRGRLVDGSEGELVVAGSKGELVFGSSKGELVIGSSDGMATTTGEREK
ncbi:UNVERIFIED_CONTAM: hypothetical protein Sradi_3159100 [Sesamum radiatum]|uniref:Uncharacterized protein n=1 Tax=Sesamum radiatum TaxID=300843 RepID=A0AAW2RG84_SESRA